MKIAIYNHGIPFDGDTVFRKPLGGSESGIIYMALELARCGHKVQVYANCAEGGNYAGVDYRHYHQFFTDYRTAQWDVVIAFRSFDPMLLGRIAPRMIFWTGDACDQPSLEHFAHPAVQQNIDRIFCVSNWHRDTFIRRFGLDGSRIIATRNGFAPELIVPHAPRPASRAAYTSTPFRGLELLLQMFPEIRTRVPGATLDLFSSMKVYGWSPEDDRKVFGSIYDTAIGQDGVRWHGSVPQPELLEALGRTGILLYPNTFEETSCISAIEAQASGCVVVTSAKAGLKETVANEETGFCIEGDPRSDDYKRRFIEKTTALMQNPDLFARMSSAASGRAFRIYSWTSIACEWTSMLEDLPPVAVSGRFSGPLSMLVRAEDYLRGGNTSAATRVLSQVEATPFFRKEIEEFKRRIAHGGAETHGCDDQQHEDESPGRDRYLG